MDQNIKKATEELSQNSSKWIELLKTQIIAMSDDEFNNVVKNFLDMMMGRDKIGSKIDFQKLDPILKGFGDLTRSFANAGTTSEYKKMAKRSARHLSNLWTTLNQEAKELIAYTLISGHEFTKCKPFD